MSVPDYYRNVSLVLSRVMDDIGVNEECVMGRRRSHLLMEKLITLKSRLLQNTSSLSRKHIYMFGSQTEGSTTPGLESDYDLLFHLKDKYVIQDVKDWSPGILNYMMIQDETTIPGYCKLQAVRPDIPLLYDRIPDQYHLLDEKCRIVLKSSIFCLSECGGERQERHGPALRVPISMKGGFDEDIVPAYYCPTWPKHYKQWSLRREVRDWPTPEMIEYMETSGCFVVDVAHCCSERPDTEWRISTSLAERCLMFNMNITQIRCYIILKMITKTFIEPFVPKVISSYICKTLLFHALGRTSLDLWREQNLLACVTRVLFDMYSAVYNMDCPNYFNESANLLLGKLDEEVTRERLLVILRKLLQSRGRFLMKIGLDNIKGRLNEYFLNTFLMVRDGRDVSVRLFLCRDLHFIASCGINKIVLEILTGNTSRNDLLKITLDYSKKGPIQYKAASTLFPFLCSHVATVDTSERIRRGQKVSPRALLLYKCSLDSDAASSRLKFASFLFCTGQYKRALLVLQQVELRMGSGAVQLCGCPSRGNAKFKRIHFALNARKNLFPTTFNVGLCVMFSRSEIQCCPLELCSEYFRSTDEDSLQSDKEIDDWMDLAILECLPFLYYLQYMTARHLGQRDLQYRALHKLIKSVFGEEHLGHRYLFSEESFVHRETAFNVLGQCMEHENRFDDALRYYRMSYQHRPRNNAVRWHFARLAYIAIQRCQK